MIKVSSITPYNDHSKSSWDNLKFFGRESTGLTFSFFPPPLITGVVPAAAESYDYCKLPAAAAQLGQTRRIFGALCYRMKKLRCREAIIYVCFLFYYHVNELLPICRADNYPGP